MRKVNTILSILSALTVMLCSCSDLLDISQHGVLNDDNFYKTDSDAEAAVAAIYGQIPALEMPYVFINGYLSDEYWQGQASRGADLGSYLSYTFASNDSYIDNYFSGLYAVIGKCNLVIDNVKPKTDFMRQAIAEAKTVRAWMFFELTTMWGNAPIVDHVMSSSEDAPSNASAADLWAFIEQDLSDAISSGALTQKQFVSDRSNYRITKQYAQALLGKAYLWQGKNKEAAEVLDEVIGSGLYGLFRGVYGDIYKVENENCEESLFESNKVYDKDNPGLTLTFVPSSTGLSAYSRPGLVEASGGANTLGLLPSACWGGFVPRGSLYQAFVAEEGEDGYRLNESIKTYQFMAEAGYPIAPGYVEYSEGYFGWKGRSCKGDLDINYLCSPRNIHWMRYAEVLLMAAEANIGIDQFKADKYLNEVRERAKLGHKTCTLDAIKTERRLELFGDFIRYKDLQRWGDAATVLADAGKIEPVLSAGGTVTWESFYTSYGYKTGKHEYLPIPDSEILCNKNIKQHDGWK